MISYFVLRECSQRMSLRLFSRKGLERRKASVDRESVSTVLKFTTTGIIQLRHNLFLNLLLIIDNSSKLFFKITISKAQFAWKLYRFWFRNEFLKLNSSFEHFLLFHLILQANPQQSFYNSSCLSQNINAPNVHFEENNINWQTTDKDTNLSLYICKRLNE